MKRVLMVFLCLALVAGAVFAQEKGEAEAGLPFSIDCGVAATFELGDNVITSDNSWDILAGLFNIFKGGAYIDGLYKINDFLLVGAEIGFYAMASEDGAVTALFDLPVLGIVELSLFDVLRVKAHGGYTFSSHLVITNNDPIVYVHKLDLGARFFLGGLYFDYSLMMWEYNGSCSSQKFGIGYEMPIL